MMGPVHSRFFAHLPASAFVRLPKLLPNSFVFKILPLTPMGSIFCLPCHPQILWNEDFAKHRGEGGIPIQPVPFREMPFASSTAARFPTGDRLLATECYNPQTLGGITRA